MNALEPQDGTIILSDAWLVGALETRKTASDFKAAAIYAFVLALRAFKDKDHWTGVQFGNLCLELLKKYPTDTLEQCASPSVSVAGELIPGLFHEGTVRRALAPLGF